MPKKQMHDNVLFRIMYYCLREDIVDTRRTDVPVVYLQGPCCLLHQSCAIQLVYATDLHIAVEGGYSTS